MIYYGSSSGPLVVGERFLCELSIQDVRTKTRQMRSRHEKPERTGSAGFWWRLTGQTKKILAPQKLVCLLLSSKYWAVVVAPGSFVVLRSIVSKIKIINSYVKTVGTCLLNTWHSVLYLTYIGTTYCSYILKPSQKIYFSPSTLRQTIHLFYAAESWAVKSVLALATLVRSIPPHPTLMFDALCRGDV